MWRWNVSAETLPCACVSFVFLMLLCLRCFCLSSISLWTVVCSPQSVTARSLSKLQKHSSQVTSLSHLSPLLWLCREQRAHTRTHTTHTHTHTHTHRQTAERMKHALWLNSHKICHYGTFLQGLQWCGCVYL